MAIRTRKTVAQAYAAAGFVKNGRYRLNWVNPNGDFVGASFDDWAKLEAFSTRLIELGMTPRVPDSCPTPYDGSA